jgi:hypothetical protein
VGGVLAGQLIVKLPEPLDAIERTGAEATAGNWKENLSIRCPAEDPPVAPVNPT